MINGFVGTFINYLDNQAFSLFQFTKCEDVRLFLILCKIDICVLDCSALTESNCSENLYETWSLVAALV